MKQTNYPRMLALSVGTIIAAGIILFHTAAESRAQSREISNTLSQLQSKQISISELDWRLLELNVTRAYEKHDDYTPQPISYNRRLQRFKTGFYVPPNSAVLRLSARTQIEQFQIEMNGLVLLLATTLDLPQSIGAKIALYVDADFTTMEDGDWVVVARYREGKVQLVHEKLKPSAK
jgi:hypothetical protein